MTSQLKRLCYTEKPHIVKCPDDKDKHSEIWFKSNPVDRELCARILQLQLITESGDRGSGVDDQDAASGSWFEVAFLADKHAAEPRQQDGQYLSFRSHCNKIGSTDLNVSHYGNPFDRRDQLLNDVEVRRPK